MNISKQAVAILCFLWFTAGPIFSQDYESIHGAVIYDHDPSTKLGDDVFGTLISDLENDFPGRNSHGGPVCMEYPNGQIVAFNTNTSDHNIDGWSEYAVSKDGGKSWEMYNRFPYSFEAYQRDPHRPAWVEAGLVTQKGTVVVFITHFINEPEVKDNRTMSGFMRSFDHGVSWTTYESVDGTYIGYPVATAVDGSTNYIVYDDFGEGHVLYVSTDNGRSWRKRSTLSLENDTWYGALTLMKDGGLLAGAYLTKDEDHFYYCISTDQGHTWTKQQKAHVDKKIRDPELAYLGGRYYLHGRSGHHGEGRHRFVLYQSDDGINWQDGIIVSGDAKKPDGYSSNCIINQYNDDVPNELMVEYSIIYDGRDTNEYVFFVKPEPEK